MHICAESDKTELCWSLERVRQEVRDQRPGALLVEQQLAYLMLVQALWLHLAEVSFGPMPTPAAIRPHAESSSLKMTCFTPFTSTKRSANVTSARSRDQSGEKYGGGHMSGVQLPDCARKKPRRLRPQAVTLDMRTDSILEGRRSK